MKRPISYHLLRFGLGITFLWIGLMIFSDPEGWGALIQPWAAHLLPAPLILTMQVTAALDMAVGIFLLLGVYVWIAAGLGALHLLTVLATVGVDTSTVRDIGLLGAGLSLTISEWPERLRFWVKK